jgi:hypothetical protein
MTILPPSPFLNPSDDADPPGAASDGGMARTPDPQPPACGPATFVHPEQDDINEIFHFARKLGAPDRQAEIDRLCLAAVENALDPTPLFLRST